MEIISMSKILLTSVIFLGYRGYTKTIKAASRRLKPAFFIPHILKLFCFKCPVAVTPGRLLSASVTLEAFLFSEVSL